ncbi:hypothetical protein ACS0TY_003568 [Phlomoides rotata]
MMRSLIRENQIGFLRFIFAGRFAFCHNVSFHGVQSYDTKTGNHDGTPSIGATLENLCSSGSSRWSLLGKLERALKAHKVDEAWESYKNFKSHYGFPDQLLVANLITESSYSPSSRCLRMACDLLLTISKEKPVLLRREMMIKLVLSLARAQIPVPTSCVLRLMLEKKSLPSLDVLRMVFLHMVKTETGTYLASNILEEICNCFQKLGVNKSAHTELTKPDVMIFNLVLDACVRFGTPLKGQQIMELMPQIGVVADAHTVVIIARIHETNCMRDELKKFKECLDMVPITLVHHYQQFYDCLLSLHFKFNDIDGASSLLLDLCGSKHSQIGQRESPKSCTVSIGSDNMKMGLKLQFLPQQLHKDVVYKLDLQQDLVLYKDGKFVLSNRGLAKLVVGYKKSERINELSKLLVSIENMLSSSEDSSPCSDVIDACIHLGWLMTAHDILEDLESEKYAIREGSYTSLLKAYYDEKMQREAEGLVRQMRRVGLAMNISDSEDRKNLDLKETCQSDLANSIIRMMRDNDKEVSFLVHGYNSSIYFFTKARMMEDARLTYRKMQKTKKQPNASTFFHLIRGYSSLGMYREITVLWGDMKRSMEYQNTVYYRELYEVLVVNFIRGGYFERVMEVIGFMMKNGMFLDKLCYKSEFLKIHRDLYRNLSVDDAKDEAQTKRLEQVKAFRKFVGIC